MNSGRLDFPQGWASAELAGVRFFWHCYQRYHHLHDEDMKLVMAEVSNMLRAPKLAIFIMASMGPQCGEF